MEFTFLLRFQERTCGVGTFGIEGGTKTLTETRESADQDPDSITAGTRTKTSTREVPDPDLPDMLTKTGTETAIRQEQSDEDQDVRRGYRVLPLAPRVSAAADFDVDAAKITTATAVREQADQQPDDVTMGTKTFTAVRNEQVDEDAGARARYRALPLARRPVEMGTKTVTKTEREASDQDAFAASMGTLTSTRAREEGDQDKSHRSYTALPILPR